jgi:hypothetical protein
MIAWFSPLPLASTVLAREHGFARPRQVLDLVSDVYGGITDDHDCQAHLLENVPSERKKAIVR